MGVDSIGSQTSGSYGVPKNNRSAVTNEGSQYVAAEHNRKVLGLIDVEEAIGTTVSPAVGSHERRINDDEAAIAALEAVRDNDPPVLITAGTISGVNEVDDDLTFSLSTFFNADTRDRQWQKDSGSGFADIVDETGLSYEMVPIDAGTLIRCVETGTNANPGSTPANSNAIVIKPHFNVAPSLVNDTTGTFPAAQGDVLSVDISGLVGSTSEAYQWLDTDGVAIPGADQPTYPVDTGETGDGVSCLVTASNTGGSTPATTAEEAVSAGAAPDAFAPSDWELNGTDSVGTLEVNILTLPADNGDPITDLERRVNGGAWVSLGTATTGTVNVSSLTSDSFDEDDLEIRAVNGIGESGPSDVKSANPPIAGLVSIGSVALVTASPDYLTIDGSTNVEVSADAVDPLDSDRWHEQVTAGNRPAFVASSAMPSGVSAIEGDGVDDILTNTTNAALHDHLDGSSKYITYLLGIPGATLGTVAGSGENSSTGTAEVSFRFGGGFCQGRHGSLGSVASLDSQGTAPHWYEFIYDNVGPVSDIENDAAETDTGAPNTTPANVQSSLCAALESGGPDGFTDSTLVVYAVFPNLTTTQKNNVRAILAALGGL